MELCRAYKEAEMQSRDSKASPGSPLSHGRGSSRFSPDKIIRKTEPLREIRKKYEYEVEVFYNDETIFLGCYKQGGEEYANRKIDLKFIKRAQKVIDLVKKFYRYESVGAENVPEGPCIFVVNHTFSTFEGVITNFNIYNWSGTWHVSGIMDIQWFKYPVLRDFFIKVGMIYGRRPFIVDALKRGIKCGILLGGPNEAYQPSANKYQIYWHDKKGRPKVGFIKCALRAQVPIVPLAHIGSEEIFYVSKAKTKFFKRNNIISYDIPYVLFKPFPYKVYEVFGQPIYLDYPPEAADDEEVLNKCFERVRSEFIDNLNWGLELKDQNTRNFCREMFNTENPRLVKFLRPFF